MTEHKTVTSIFGVPHVRVDWVVVRQDAHRDEHGATYTPTDHGTTWHTWTGDHAATDADIADHKATIERVEGCRVIAAQYARP